MITNCFLFDKKEFTFTKYEVFKYEISLIIFNGCLLDFQLNELDVTEFYKFTPIII
jgi:hypothetical protein